MQPSSSSTPPIYSNTTSGIISSLNDRHPHSGNLEERSLDCLYQVAVCAETGANLVSSSSCIVRALCLPVNLVGSIIGGTLGCLSSPFAFFCGRSLGVREKREEFVVTLPRLGNLSQQPPVRI